jgi:hypothetical protein
MGNLNGHSFSVVKYRLKSTVKTRRRLDENVELRRVFESLDSDGSGALSRLSTVN